MFCCLSANSIALATVTPSLVILGAPKDCSITTLRPLGPSVTCTARPRAVTAEPSCGASGPSCENARRGCAAHLHRVGKLVDALEHERASVDAEAHVLARHVAHRRAQHARGGARRSESREPGVGVGQGYVARRARDARC